MIEFLRTLLDADLMPRGHGYGWRPEIVWLHTLSDGVIAVTFFSILAVLFHFVRKRGDIAFHWGFVLFAAFIVACGTTHALSIWTLWVPAYGLEGIVKLGTALLSIATAIALWPLLPQAIHLPGPSQLEDHNRELRRQIMERKLAEQRVRHMNVELERRVAERTAELRRSNEELEQFAYVASHDLQEPLRMVSNYTELLAQRYRGRLDPEADEFMAHAIDGARRMHTLVNDLLELTRVDASPRAFEPADCEGVLADVLANLRVVIGESGAGITHDPLPTVAGDRSQLGQLFQNLLANAIKFHGDQPARVHVAAHDEDGVWRFSVRDNGIGMDPSHTERIFVLFQRLNTRRQYSGNGVGLAVCRKIVERHGGRIWAESQPGGGSVFYFTLPVLEAAQASA
jgi:signal transduction histidine kinase